MSQLIGPTAARLRLLFRVAPTSYPTDDELVYDRAHAEALHHSACGPVRLRQQQQQHEHAGRTGPRLEWLEWLERVQRFEWLQWLGGRVDVQWQRGADS